MRLLHRRFHMIAAMTALLTALPVDAAASEPERGQRPNILFILADDYGIDGVGCYGSDRFSDKTPHLDALAQTGTRFERCYATPNDTHHRRKLWWHASAARMPHSGSRRKKARGSDWKQGFDFGTKLWTCYMKNDEGKAANQARQRTALGGR